MLSSTIDFSTLVSAYAEGVQLLAELKPILGSLAGTAKWGSQN